MVNARNGFTYTANLVMLSISLVLFLAITSPTLQFRILAIICISIGMCSSMFYICTIKENSLSQKANECEQKYQQAISGESDTLKIA